MHFDDVFRERLWRLNMDVHLGVFKQQMASECFFQLEQSRKKRQIITAPKWPFYVDVLSCNNETVYFLLTSVLIHYTRRTKGNDQDVN